MGKIFEGIDGKLGRFLAEQHVFFVATAPTGAEGHVNLSPKGHDTFRVLDERTVAYLDYIGSGVETIAQLRQNGRITLMFCAFDGPPRIVRLQGRGRVVGTAEPEFKRLSSSFAAQEGVRSIIVATLDRIADSCGYGVPLLTYSGERPQLQAWVDHKGAEGLAQYVEEHSHSIDGLPALV